MSLLLHNLVDFSSSAQLAPPAVMEGKFIAAEVFILVLHLDGKLTQAPT